MSVRVFDETLFNESQVRLPSLRAYDAARTSALTSLDTGRESLVQQQFQEDADINVIVRRFGLVNAQAVDGVYGDFTGISDFESAVAAVNRAQVRFMELPADVREKFGNDPGRLIRAARDMGEGEFNERYFTATEPVIEPEDAPA